MKNYILLVTLLIGGLSLPASAERNRNIKTSVTIFISGYNHGQPIYSKRIKQGRSVHVERLRGIELKNYLRRNKNEGIRRNSRQNRQPIRQNIRNTRYQYPC